VETEGSTSVASHTKLREIAQRGTGRGKTSLNTQTRRKGRGGHEKNQNSL